MRIIILRAVNYLFVARCRFERNPTRTHADVKIEAIAEYPTWNYLLPDFSKSWILPKLRPDDLKGVIHSDPEIMAGTPVLVRTRVPLQNLIDSLESGESIEDFLDSFPTI